MKSCKLLLFSLIMALLLASCGQGAADSDQGAAGHKTPEDAINAFVSAVAANDIEEAMSLGAFNKIGENYDIMRMAEDTKAYIFMSQMAPPDYPAYARLNQLRQQGAFATVMELYIMSFFLDEDNSRFFDTKPAILSDEQELAEFGEFLKSIDPSQLEGLKVVKTVEPMPERMNSEQGREIAKRQAARYGADDATELVAVYQLGDQYFAGGFRLLKYGDGWWIESLHSNYANQSSMGMVLPLTKKEADNISELLS